jgi:hypothetical protein
VVLIGYVVLRVYAVLLGYASPFWKTLRHNHFFSNRHG